MVSTIQGLNEVIEGLEGFSRLQNLSVSAILQNERRRRKICWSDPLRYLETFTDPLEELMSYAAESMDHGGRDRNLPELAKPYISNNANLLVNTDKNHTLASLEYLLEIIGTDSKLTESEAKILLSAMICHDCAYPRTRDFKDFTSEKNRKGHMRDGAKAFKRFSPLIRDNGNPFYTTEETDKISRIIGQHDNPSIKKDFDYKILRPELIYAFREADRLWMLDKAGFALDLMRGFLEGEKVSDFDLVKRLNEVVQSHIKEAEIYKGYPHDEYTKKIKENDDLPLYEGNRTLYRTNKGFEIFKRLCKERIKQYGLQEIIEDITKLRSLPVHLNYLNPKLVGPGRVEVYSGEEIYSDNDFEYSSRKPAKNYFSAAELKVIARIKERFTIREIELSTKYPPNEKLKRLIESAEIVTEDYGRIKLPSRNVNARDYCQEESIREYLEQVFRNLDIDTLVEESR